MSNDESLTTEAERLGNEMNGQPDRVVEANLPRLLELLKEVSTPDELVAVIDALGYAWDENASVSVLRFADHSDARVRLATKSGIMMPSVAEATTVTPAPGPSTGCCRPDSAAVRHCFPCCCCRLWPPS